MSRKTKSKGKGHTKIRTPLSGHTRIGKTLVPPLMRMPGGVNFSSWCNERLPEMLWAALLINVYPRNDALGAFREIAALGVTYSEKSDECIAWSLNLSSLAKQPYELISSIVKIIKKHPLATTALRPLLLLESLPARDVWKTEIAVVPEDGDWQTLGEAVLKCFDHQSQEATDIRWLKLMFKICLGGLQFAPTMEGKIEELRLYPNKGDMRSVRPFIRAGEMSLDVGPDGEKLKEPWPEDFWLECMDRTTCLPAHPPKGTGTTFDRKEFLDGLMDTRMSVIEHWSRSLSTTGVDPRHDTVFGFALYSLSCILEMASVSNRHGISGRLFLRCLTESRITLAYLVRLDDPKLWKRFRTYGAGQVKLALLKIEEMSGAKPSFIQKTMLAFYAFAVLAASKINATPVEIFVPENGFISINPPLVPGRSSSLSTRTTHPLFMQMLQELIDGLGINVRFELPYRFKTKGEMLRECRNQTLLARLASHTTSCGRYRTNNRQHCGRCVPCMIRKSAFLAWNPERDTTTYSFVNLSRSAKKSGPDDPMAAALAVLDVRQKGIGKFLGATLAFASADDRPHYSRMLEAGMLEIETLLRRDGII